MKLLILLIVLLFASCTENKTQTDADTQDNNTVEVDAIPDFDAVVDEAPDPDYADVEIQDGDADANISEEEFIDDCDVKLIDAPFPYTDNDGKLTFCRPGCDTPTEKDPQCVSNLWKEQNYDLCHQEPEFDCCGYPCVLESLKPVTKEEEDQWGEYAIPMHKCDLKISPERWGADGSGGVIKSWNLSNKKTGLFLHSAELSVEKWPIDFKFVTYDIETQKYNIIAPARNQEQAYYKGNRIAMISDKRSLELNNSNIFLAYIGDNGKIEIVYNKIISHTPYVPALNDKWVFVNVQEPNQNSKAMYAEIGKWEWTTLRQGECYAPVINGDNLFVTDENNSYICDLSKSPKSLADCLRINEDDERIGSLYFDKDNVDRVVFSRKHEGAYTIVLGEKEGDAYKRTDLVKDFTEATAKYSYSLVPMTLQGDTLLYEEVAVVNSRGSGLLCYYRIDKKKKYCMKKMDKDETVEDGTVIYPYSFAEFEGKWLLYQKRNSNPLILRDMECYCKEEGVCPFEE